MFHYAASMSFTNFDNSLNLGNLFVGCEELCDRHLILGQRASLVRTDHVHAACNRQRDRQTSHTALAANNYTDIQ